MGTSFADNVNTAIEDIGKKFKNGLKNTSTRRFDELSKIVAAHFGIAVADIKIIAAGKASNAWNRFAEGRAVKNHFKLGIGIMSGSDAGSALSPIRAFIGPGNGRYDCIALVSNKSGKWIFTDVVGKSAKPYAVKFKEVCPDIKFHNIGTTSLTTSRDEYFSNLEKKFNKWLSSAGVKGQIARSHYVRNLKAIGLPYQGKPKAKSGKWDGFCEYFLGVKPEKGVFDVNGLAEFEKSYGKLKLFFTSDDVDYGDYDKKKYDECFQYFHASHSKKKVKHKDQRYTLTAYNKFMLFLQEMEKKFGGIMGGLSTRFDQDIEGAGLSYEPLLTKRFLSALLAKPFVILTGLSGSGKTKLAEAFTHWLYGKDEYDKYVRQVAVGADWTNSEKLLGYPNALNPKEYVMPDTGVLQLIREASREENKDKPFFLILDEMNLSHVERYFADFLSTMESVDGDIHLYDGEDRYEGGDETNPEKRIEHRIKFPRNLFVIGTMNVDETTYMFSPKVLDRAQVIEFVVGADDLTRYFGGTKGLKFENLDGRGAEYAEAFLKKSHEEHPFSEAAKGVLTALFPKLKKLGAEFGFRTAGEFSDFVTIFESFGVGKPEDAIDAAIVQKLLPKLHGSQGVFSSVLAELLTYVRPVKEDADKVKLAEHAKDSDDKELYDYIYPLSADKLERMSDRLRDNGFASFAEA